MSIHFLTNFKILFLICLNKDVLLCDLVFSLYAYKQFFTFPINMKIVFFSSLLLCEYEINLNYAKTSNNRSNKCIENEMSC